MMQLPSLTWLTIVSKVYKQEVFAVLALTVSVVLPVRASHQLIISRYFWLSESD